MTYNSIERILSNALEIGFDPNEGNKAGSVFLCFQDPKLAYLAYADLAKNIGRSKILLKIREHSNLLDLSFIIDSQDVEIKISKRKYDKTLFDLFKSVNGGGDHICVLIGFLPARSFHILMNEGDSPIVCSWKIES